MMRQHHERKAQTKNLGRQTLERTIIQKGDNT